MKLSTVSRQISWLIRVATEGEASAIAGLQMEEATAKVDGTSLKYETQDHTVRRASALSCYSQCPRSVHHIQNEGGGWCFLLFAGLMGFVRE